MSDDNEIPLYPCKLLLVPVRNSSKAIAKFQKPEDQNMQYYKKIRTEKYRSKQARVYFELF